MLQLFSNYFPKLISQSLRLSLGFIFFGCTNLFFQPSRIQYTTPDRYQLKYQSFFFDSFDGTKLHAWKIPRKDIGQKSLGTIILFHGNAQNLSSHFLNLAWVTEHKYDLMIFDYHGYGQSEGIPSQKGVNEDGIRALEVASEWSKENGSPLIAFGQSLGGAIMMRSIANFKDSSNIKFIILDSTFLSYQKIAFKKLVDSCLFSLLSPLAFIIVNEDYYPRNFLKKLPNSRYLVMHAPKDPMVPYSLGEKVFKKLKTQQKEFWEIKEGFHADAFFVENYKYRKMFIEYLRENKK